MPPLEAEASSRFKVLALKNDSVTAFKTAKRRGRKIGICGQGPSDFPDFATFLVELGIDSTDPGHGHRDPDGCA